MGTQNFETIRENGYYAVLVPVNAGHLWEVWEPAAEMLDGEYIDRILGTTHDPVKYITAAISNGPKWAYENYHVKFEGPEIPPGRPF